MRMIYFIVTSSFLILLTLFIRSLFRKKLSPGVIYALWLIPYLRLLVPLGFVEVPMFGVAANFLNSPFFVIENSEIEYVHNDVEMIGVYSDYVPEEKSNLEHNGIKIYDSVFEKGQSSKEGEDSQEVVPLEKEDGFKVAAKEIALIIWLWGTSIIGVYVIVQNRKLQKEIDTLDVVGKIDGINICLSPEVKTPCLVGVRNPRILITKNVYENARLYEYAIRHELAHFHQKDHLWNAGRIAMCVFYWWNPLVWYAAKCASEDAELACDARVLKKSSLEDRKNYAFALLELLEYAPNEAQNIRFATSVFGNRNSMKRRIQEISNKTMTRKYILFPVLLLLVLLMAVGCVYPSNQSYIKTSDWTTGEPEIHGFCEANYKYSLQDEFQSMLFYYENYEYGELVERSILSYGEIEKYSNTFLLRTENHTDEEKEYFIFEMNGIEISIPIPYVDKHKGYAISSVICEKDLLEIEPGDDIILMAKYPEKQPEFANTYICRILETYDDEELNEVLNNNDTVSFVRLVLSDIPTDKLYEQMQTKEFPVDRERTNGRILADSWVKAFVDKDADTRIESLFLDHAESNWRLLECVSAYDFAYDHVGVVLYTEKDSEFVNIGFIDKEGIIQHCGIEAVLDENPEFTYHGKGEVTFNVCSKDGMKYKQKITFSKDDDGVNFVSEFLK